MSKSNYKKSLRQRVISAVFGNNGNNTTTSNVTSAKQQELTKGDVDMFENDLVKYAPKYKIRSRPPQEAIQLYLRVQKMVNYTYMMLGMKGMDIGNTPDLDKDKIMSDLLTYLCETADYQMTVSEDDKVLNRVHGFNKYYEMLDKDVEEATRDTTLNKPYNAYDMGYDDDEPVLDTPTPRNTVATSDVEFKNNATHDFNFDASAFGNAVPDTNVDSQFDTLDKLDGFESLFENEPHDVDTESTLSTEFDTSTPFEQMVHTSQSHDTSFTEPNETTTVPSSSHHDTANTTATQSHVETTFDYSSIQPVDDTLEVPDFSTFVQESKTEYVVKTEDYTTNQRTMQHDAQRNAHLSKFDNVPSVSENEFDGMTDQTKNITTQLTTGMDGEHFEDKTVDRIYKNVQSKTSKKDEFEFDM